MSDLVKRLRRYANSKPNILSDALDDVAIEAAARIEQLEAQLAKADELAKRASQQESGIPMRPGYVKDAILEYRQARGDMK